MYRPGLDSQRQTTTCLTNKLADFLVVIVPMNFHHISQTCHRHTYLVRVLIRVPGRLLLKDFYKANLRMFIDIRYMICESNFEQRDPTTDVISSFNPLSVKNRGEVPHSKCSIQIGVFDSPCFKRFAAFIDHFLLWWSIKHPVSGFFV